MLCENVIYSQSCMNDVLTHELIHAYDFARVKYDVNNLRHLACTEVSNDVNFTNSLSFIVISIKNWNEFFINTISIPPSYEVFNR